MSSVAEIEQAIAELSRRDFSSLAQWFEEERSRKWDLQMEEDEKSGKLQALHKRLEEENRDHAEIPLDDFCLRALRASA